ncbi:hypothetical protein OIDMADRAFT_54562 [Oidiodendron maius Zn]|uniref:Uncharacterized protein n=1 Tax=Oidiodendron maius (strain Zn) TaxID=913774 RepID=A0A0C3HGE0_OIDMZ|nr:hypothetical protein OIDMADRAFT_54562 [Oidiodendron maius Zn]
MSWSGPEAAARPPRRCGTGLAVLDSRYWASAGQCESHEGGSRQTGKRNSVGNQASQVPFAGTMLLPQLHAEGWKVGESQNRRSAAPSGTLVAGSEDEDEVASAISVQRPLFRRVAGHFLTGPSAQ